MVTSRQTAPIFHAHLELQPYPLLIRSHRLEWSD
jgi:hypothetical protein